MSDELTMTKAKAIEHIKINRRVCRGPVLGGAVSISNKLLANKKLTKEEIRIAGAFVGDVPGTTYSVGTETYFGFEEVIKHNPLEAARKIKSAGRGGCGYDFNKTILKNPLDGKRRAYECPECKVTGYYTPPLVRIE